MDHTSILESDEGGKAEIYSTKTTAKTMAARQEIKPASQFTLNNFMISEYLLNISHKLYKRRLEKARISSYRYPLFFPSGRARELMRYIKNGQSMFVLMAPYSKGTFCVSAKSIDHWDVDGGNEPATDEEKREVLKAAVEYLKKHDKKVVIIDPQPWQIE